MTTDQVARCAIYDGRPEVCRVYPKVEHYLPEECTYYFIDGKRLGSCECNVGACCQIPRKNGEPGGAPIPAIAGGEPCKYLEWQEPESEKLATIGVPWPHGLESNDS